MQIVIDIPNKAYENIVKNEYDYGDMNVIIQNGIPLPKGHGRLIDADALRKVYDKRITYLYALNKKDNPSRETRICTTNWCTNTIDELPTIIEADKEERYEVN